MEKVAPFKSEAQRKWMYANHPAMADRWAKHTSSEQMKNLPEHVKKAGVIECFSKIAKKLFNPMEMPPVPAAQAEHEMMETAKEEKMKGASPVVHRRKLEVIKRN